MVIAAVIADVTPTARFVAAPRITRNRDDRADREVEAEQPGDRGPENDADRSGDTRDERQPTETVRGREQGDQRDASVIVESAARSCSPRNDGCRRAGKRASTNGASKKASRP